MAKFTRFNNHNRKRKTRKSPYSEQYIEERRNEMYKLMANTETDEEKDILQKAFSITINP